MKAHVLIREIALPNRWFLARYKYDGKHDGSVLGMFPSRDGCDWYLKKQWPSGYSDIAEIQEIEII